MKSLIKAAESLRSKKIGQKMYGSIGNSKKQLVNVKQQGK
jgi:hypothetical protein